MLNIVKAHLQNKWDYYIPLFLTFMMIELSRQFPTNSFVSIILTMPIAIFTALYVQNWRRKKDD